MKVSVVIPSYNEVNTIKELLRRVQAENIAEEILVVDDGSTDGTRDILNDYIGKEPYRIIFHEQNQGKGAAVRTGIQQSIGDIIIIQDADLEYNPREYKKLLEPIVEGMAEVVYGSRFLDGPRRAAMFWHMVANKLLTFLTNILYNNILTDMETGYKVFLREVVQDMPLRSNRFDFEPEFTAKILKRKVRIFEVPITFNPTRLFGGKEDWYEGCLSGSLDFT